MLAALIYRCNVRFRLYDWCYSSQRLWVSESLLEGPYAEWPGDSRSDARNGCRGATAARIRASNRAPPITMFAPEQHDLYDGHYMLSANRIYMVGGLNDPVGWDHMDNDAKTVKPVSGTAEIDVNDLTNTGKFEARLKIPEGDLVLAIDKFNEFNPARTAGSSASCTSTERIRAAATTTGRRRSCTWPAGDSATRR